MKRNQKLEWRQIADPRLRLQSVAGNKENDKLQMEGRNHQTVKYAFVPSDS